MFGVNHLISLDVSCSQEKLNQPISAPPSPRDSAAVEEGLSENLAAHVRYLKKEVDWLRRQLKSMQVTSSSIL